MDINFTGKTLIPIWQKIQNGERLTLEDGLVLYKSNDLISLGKMANYVAYQKSGDAVYFVLNRKIEHTNVCV
ncbi:MAG: aminofutalosine synthase MqnE, partial [Bacteroidetes bacterium]|nr:aminofutalosine synthase MqnE [Bacteroidota bacterium]